MQFKQFYNDSIEHRRQRLNNHHIQGVNILSEQQHDDDIFNHLIENYIASFEQPLGVATNFLIDDKDIIIPMVNEEPSVIAAASHAAKLVRQGGGFHTTIHQRAMTGQVVLEQINHLHKAKETIIAKKEELIQLLNDMRPSMVKRGGGVLDLEVKLFPDIHTLTINFYINTVDAMGANMINSLMEAIAPTLEQWTGGKKLLAILSNYSDHCLCQASARIPLTLLGDTAEKMVRANRYAKLDPIRATTHNKGIMNGVEAVVRATGNDTRAISAAIHAYAARNGQYQPLTQYILQDEALYAEITLPLPVGSIGGATKVIPKAKASLAMMDVTSAAELMRIIASVGLAQNIAALKALVSEGIQKGHMGLQAKSLAIQVGAKDDEITAVAERLKQQPMMTEPVAIQLLHEYRQTKKEQQ